MVEIVRHCQAKATETDRLDLNYSRHCSTRLHPREVFKAAILSNASSIALVHSHPSGSLNPSLEDIDITRKLVQCGDILGIKVIDHIIVSDDRHLSFAERKIGGL